MIKMIVMDMAPAGGKAAPSAKILRILITFLYKFESLRFEFAISAFDRQKPAGKPVVIWTLADWFALA